MKNYGDYIKQARKQSNMTQKEVAEALNVAVSTVSSWETSRTDVSPEMTEKLAKLFNVEVGTLFGHASKTHQSSSIPNHSKPYLDVNYRFNKGLFILLLVTTLFTVLSPILEGILATLYIVLWITYLSVLLIFYLRSFKKNTGTKYFSENETLYYKYSASKEKRHAQKKDIKSLLGIIFIAINVATVLPFATVHSVVEDVSYYTFFGLSWMMINLLLIYIFFYDAKEKHTGETIAYEVLSVNFYLGRYKLLYMFYALIFIVQYLVLSIYEINPYKGLSEVAIYIIMTLTLFFVYALYEANKHYYAHYKIAVKGKYIKNT